jgi:hypothetical protein
VPAPTARRAGGRNHAPAISESGAVVSFFTDARNLGEGIGADAYDVVVRERVAGTTTVAGAPPSGPLVKDLDYVDVLGGRGQLTPDARYAGFESGHDPRATWPTSAAPRRRPTTGRPIRSSTPTGQPSPSSRTRRTSIRRTPTT